MIIDISDFEQIKEDWNSLYNPDNDTVFQSFSYNYIASSLYYSTTQIHLLAYKSGTGTIDAIFPFCVIDRTIRMINDINTDYCDFIYSKSCNLHTAFKELVEYLSSVKYANRTCFINIRPTSPFINYITLYKRGSYAFSNNLFTFLNVQHSENPINNLELHSGHKKKLMRIIKDTSDMPFRVYDYKEGDPFPVQDLQELSEYMISAKLRSKHYLNDTMWRFIRESYESDILKVAILYNKNNEPLSSGFIFYNSNKTIRWIILYKETKFNLWNNTLFLYNMGLKSDFVLDFGRGGYDYKIGNFKPNVSILMSVCFGITFWGDIKSFLCTMYYVSKNYAKKYIKK